MTSVLPAITVTAPKVAPEKPEPEQTVGKPDAAQDFWGKDGMTFADLLDIVNPLQHIPVLSSIYRKVTGDELSTGARMLGGALLGGVVGLAAATVNAIAEQETGKDLGAQMLAMATGENTEPKQIAQAAKKDTPSAIAETTHAAVPTTRIIESPAAALPPELPMASLTPKAIFPSPLPPELPVAALPDTLPPLPGLTDKVAQEVKRKQMESYAQDVLLRMTDILG